MPHNPLRSASIFSSLSDQDIDTLVASLRVVDVGPDEVFLREGEIGDTLYIVLEGEIEVIKAMGTRHEHPVVRYAAGELIGEMSVLNPGQPRAASVKTCTQTKMLAATRRDLAQMLIDSPPLAANLLQILSRRLHEASEATIRDLRAKNRELRQAYADLQTAQEKIIEQEVLTKELMHAHRIQNQMLPAVLPELPGFEIGARMMPARSVGGDLYDVIQLDDERLVVVVGDVAGKGIPAALYMALVASLLRATADQALSPEEVVRRVNGHLIEREMDSMFVTLLYAEISLKTGELMYVRAGHEQPQIWNAQGKRLLLPQARAVPLGLTPKPLLDAQTVTLTPGSTMLLISDGMTEAVNSDNEMFGLERLLEVATDPAQQSAQLLCNRLIDEVLAYHGDAPQFDDMTLLALRRG